MKLSGIVYTSNTGYTAQYAQMLGEKTGLPVYDLAEASKKLAKGNDVLYLGWLMAGNIQGYRKAARDYRLRAVCAVGMSATGSQLEYLRKNNAIPEEVPLYHLQGGFELNRLHGVYKLMMTIMKNTAGKGLADKADRTPDEDALLDLLQNGGSRVNGENLDGILGWYEENKEE